MDSPRGTARTAGVFWLVTFVMGVVAMITYQRALAGGITALPANESLYRMSIVANIIATVAYIGAALYIYYLLAPVNRHASALAALFGIIGCATSALTFALQLAPFAILRSTVEEAETWARMFLTLSVTGSRISFLFFGLHVFLVGALILRSPYMHRLVGYLMLLGGLGWLTYAMSYLLAPSFARFLVPYILLPGMIGEGSLIVWLLAKGVNVERWTEEVAR
jgi:hypothetical protein